MRIKNYKSKYLYKFSENNNLIFDFFRFVFTVQQHIIKIRVISLTT